MKQPKNEARMSQESRIAVIETIAQNINSNLLELKQEIRSCSDKNEARFDKIDSRFDRLENRLWSNFFWLISMIFGLAGLIAHSQHWI